ncbi:MAG: hypothetical protein H0W72_06970 [Planctomycetes bacterium]|nr:hypothetical protein [Planctomycetota bacterium]
MSNVLSGRDAGHSLWEPMAKALSVDRVWLMTGKGDAPVWARATEPGHGPYSEVVAILGAAGHALARIADQRGEKVEKALKAIELARKAVAGLEG